MNDKQQLAAMGAEMAEQQQQPMCMAKRIEELEAQVEKLTNRLTWRNTGSPNGLRRFMTQKQYDTQTPGIQKWYEPIRYEVPEGWQLVPVDPIKCIDMGWAYLDAARDDNPDRDWAFSHAGYKAMIAAAPSPDSAK